MVAVGQVGQGTPRPNATHALPWLGPGPPRIGLVLGSSRFVVSITSASMRPGTTTIPRTRRCAEARWTTGSTAAVTVGTTNVAANRRSRQCSSRDHGQRPRRELMRPVKIRSTGTQVGRAQRPARHCCCYPPGLRRTGREPMHRSGHGSSSAGRVNPDRCPTLDLPSEHALSDADVG